MSKDGRDNFAKKLREWFKAGGASSGISNSATVPLTDEICKELDKESPIEIRLAAVQNLTQQMATKNIDREYGPETLWGLLSDLLSPFSQPHHRIIVLRLFIALSSGNRYLGLMRPIYFNYILDNFVQEDQDTMFDFFCNVMNHGRNIEYVEDSAPQLFIGWLPRLLDSSRTMQALDVVINMIKFNSPHLESSSLHAIAHQACKQMKEANCEEVAVKCLDLLDTMTAYSSFPRISLPMVSWILAFSVNAPSLVSLALKVTKNLLGTDVGVSATMHMHDLIIKSSDAFVVRGAIFYLTHMVWGPFKINNLKQKTIQLIVALKEASENNNELVVYEIALGILRLVSEESTNLSPSLWGIVITIVGNLSSHTKMMSTEAFAKQSILSVLQDIVVILSELVEKKNYFGLPQQLYSLIEDYSDIQTEGAIMKLLEDKEKIITMTTNSEEWLLELCMVMKNYFTIDSRPKVKLAALDLFTKTYDKRHMHAAEITKKIVPTYMGEVDKEGNVSLKTAIVRQLVKMALREHGNEAMEIVRILEKLVLAPYTRDEKGPLTIDDVYDIEKAVDSLILLFKCKMWEAPITLSINIYYILLSCLEQHYKEPELLFRAVSIRYQIFEMIFEMRINSNYQVGFPRIHHSSCEGKSMDIDYLLSPYSRYLILAHTDNIKLSETDKQLYRREALIFGHSPTKESRTFKNVTEEKLLSEYSSMKTDILKDKEIKMEEHNTAQDIKGNEDKVDKSEVRDNEENVERQRIAEDMPEKDEVSAADKHEEGTIPKKRITSPKRPNTETNGKGAIPKRYKVNSPKNTSISKEVTEDIESAIPKSPTPKTPTEQLQSPDDPARSDTEDKTTTLPADSTDKSCTGTYTPETHTQQTKEASNSLVTKPALLSLSTTATIILQALKVETDWIVLRQILKGLPHAIVNKIFLLTDDGREIEQLALYLCLMVTDRSLNLPNRLLNTSQNFTWSDFQTYVYPVLASLASHHMYLRHSVQMQVVRSLQLGVINRVAGGVCLMALTVCVVEMSAMVKEMHNVISHFSTITPTPHISRPMMEFLSCVLHFPSLHRNFVPEQYKAVFALAIPYTNPLKFNHYIVSLAYHVVSMWFLKCQMKNKVHIADYIIKSLNGILIDIRRHFKEKKIKAPPKPTSPWKRAKPVKIIDDSDEKLQFYIDQQETLMDLMFQNMITSFPVHAKRDCIGEMLMAEGSSKRWLIGNKVITITTSGCPQRVLKHGLCDRCIQMCTRISKALSKRDTAGAEASLGKAQSNEPSNSDSLVESSTPSQATATSEVYDTGDMCDSTIVPELRHPPLKQFSKEDGLSGEFMSMVITEHQQEPRPVSDPLPQHGSDYESLIDSSREKQSSKRKPARPASTQEGGHHITEEHTQNKMLRKDDMLPLQFQEKTSIEATTSNEGSKDISCIDGQREDPRKIIAEMNVCACWCRNYAEVHIRQPSGDVSWTLRVENDLLLDSDGSEVPLEDLHDLYFTTSFFEEDHSSVFNSGSASQHKIIDSKSALSIMTSPLPTRRIRGYSIADTNPATRKLLRSPQPQPGFLRYEQEPMSGITPGFVFLQLFYHERVSDENKPIPLPDTQQIDRAITVIDYIKPQEIHKIGVLYVGPDQTTEQEILSNTVGSLRYMFFIRGLGITLELGEVSQKEVFLGGLDTNGVDGTTVCVWHDKMMQVVFHIATMMPTKESDPKCIGKKRHIGNNYVTIVYNESGNPYNINTIKGQFNHAVVEIQPGHHRTNTVQLLFCPELKEFMVQETPRLVSDDSLPLLVRQLALHADLASMVRESIVRPIGGPYTTSRVERLRLIRKIRHSLVGESKKPESSIIDALDLCRGFLDIMNVTGKKWT